METFPIVKRKDIARTQVKSEGGEIVEEGRYITKDTILEIYGEMAECLRANIEQRVANGTPASEPTTGHLPLAPSESTRQGWIYPPARPPTLKATSSPWKNGPPTTGPSISTSQRRWRYE
ncbi:MAG: hypothetical protein HDKAJFGB_03994 [Anaerolineae bacterium]|nr:hypothetical protein [Anaerolineae bacterium]